MLKFAQRTILVLSVTMLAGAPVAMADPKPPAKPATNASATETISLSYDSITWTYST